MNFIKKTLVITASLSGLYVSAATPLIINELMQSNIDLVFDDLNDFPDSWVELHNPGSEPVDLGGYAICTEADPSKAYRLPSLTVAPGGYAVVYCDKVGEGLHADFRLDSGKGAGVYLFAEGDMVDGVSGLKKQPAPNIAYGRTTDGAETWGYMATPTPGSANCGTTLKDMLDEPVFSTPGRVGNEPVTLSLSLPDGAPEGTVIRYTTDGSEPTASSAIYATPIEISATTAVRAKLFCEGWLSPRSTVNSYIFHPREMTLPILSMTGDSEYFYDDKIGILVEGTNPGGLNYKQNWRRPVNLEYFAAEGAASAINQLCETRVKGGGSRFSPLKSLAIYANKRFGTKRFTYEFFPDDAPGINEWKSIEIQSAGNDFDGLYMRDQVIQRVMGKRVDVDWQPTHPVVLYLNGEYMGLLHLRPRSNEDYVYSFYDGLEDIELWENWWELKAGDGKIMETFRPFYRGGEPHSMAEYSERIDVQEYMNVMTLSIFFINLDFPGSNIIQWIPTTGDGRWRWIIKDTDLGMGRMDIPHDFKVLDWWHDPDFDSPFDWGNSLGATAILRHLLMDPVGRDLFIDRLGAYMGDFLTLRGVSDEMDALYAKIDTELEATIDKYGSDPGRMPGLIAAAKEWVARRVPFFYSDMARFFSLGTPVALTIDAGRTDDIALNVNGHTVSYRDFDGMWWAGRTLRLSATAKDDDTAVGKWTVRTTRAGETTVQTYDTGMLELTVPEADCIEISTVTDQSSITTITTPGKTGFDPSAPFEVTDMAGRSLGTYDSTDALRGAVAPGVYIVRQGSVTVKHLVR